MSTAADALPTHDPREALLGLLEILAASTRAAEVPRELEPAVDSVLGRHGAPTATSWPRLLDDLARGVGLRVAWRAGVAEDVLEEVQTDLPVVTWTEHGWIVVRTSGTGHAVRRAPGPERFRALRPGDLPQASTAWALVEDALPGSMFAGPPDLPPMRRLAGLLRAEREDLGLVLVYAAGAGLLGLATPVAVQVFVNTLAFGAFRQPLVWLSLMLLVCLGLSAGLRAVQRWVIELLQRRVFVRMVADLSERLPRVRLDAFDRVNGPELVNRFFDVLTVQKAMSSLLLDGLGASLQALVGMVLLALYHPALLGFDVLLLVAIVILVAGLGRRAQDTAVVESKKKYAVAGWLEEIAAHPTTYKLGGGSDLAVRRADALARQWTDARAAHFRIYFRQYGGALALQAIASTALLAIGGWLVLERQLTLGQLIAAELVVAQVLIGFAKFSEKLETFYDLLAAVDKLGQLVDLPLERSHGWHAEEGSGPAQLTVRDLGWTTEEGRALFRGLDLSVGPGEVVAVVGEPGSGRSTLADILLGMRVPPTGQVWVDGHDLREIRLTSLRERVALVRGIEHVSGSIADNVGLGRPSCDGDRVGRALERVGLTQVVAELPDGVDTAMRPSGAPLSEGQRARLAVARAIAAEPRLVVVDSLLDLISPADRKALWGALTAPGVGWTLVVLTREASVADAATRSYRIEDGKLVRRTPTKGGA